MIDALLWDVDGTLAETELDGHLLAFNEAFQTLGLAWRWSDERYGQLLKVAGGRERLLHDMQGRDDAPSDARERDALAERVHRCKNTLYTAIVKSGKLPLRPGVRELIAECSRAGVRLGIVTTTSRSNATALLDAHWGDAWGSTFSTVITADEAPKKKPDSQAYLLALESLDLTPRDAIAMEDSPAGAAAAQAAGIPVVVTRSRYFPDTPAAGALAAGPSLGDTRGWVPAADGAAQRIDLQQLIRWHAT